MNWKNWVTLVCVAFVILIIGFSGQHLIRCLIMAALGGLAGHLAALLQNYLKRS
jgi:hypothetical protein